MNIIETLERQIRKVARRLAFGALTLYDLGVPVEVVFDLVGSKITHSALRRGIEDIVRSRSSSLTSWVGKHLLMVEQKGEKAGSALLK